MSFETTDIITLIRGLIDDNLNLYGRDSFRYVSSNVFSLSSNYINSSSLVVSINGTELDEADWTYNSTTNKIIINPTTSGVTLIKNDDVVITYSFYEKYSDNEIAQYLKSSLMYFTKFKYKKRFYMDSNNEIYASNGEQPTDEEGDLISIVTAINIDPQNITIKMPDFTLIPSEKRSKNEQIEEAITNYNRSYGTIKFLEEQN